MATTFNIDINQGSTLDLRFRVRDDDGDPINLSGFSSRGVAKFRYGTGSVLLNLYPEVVSGNAEDATLGASGFIDVYIRPNVTSGVPIVQGVYDIEKYLNVPAASGDWDVQKVARGYINIIPEVTTSMS